MLLYIVSDLHICDRSSADDFKESEEAFFVLLSCFLPELRDRFRVINRPEAQKLLILGDLLELWQTSIYSVCSVYSELLSHLAKLSDEGRLTYITGNHDELYSHLNPIAKLKTPGGVEILHFNDLKLFLCHGHQFDKFKGNSKLARAVTWTTGMLERSVSSDVDEKLVRLRNSRRLYPLNRFFKQRNPWEYLNRLEGLRLLTKADLAFMGHLHRTLLHFKGKTFSVENFYKGCRFLKLGTGSKFNLSLCKLERVRHKGRLVWRIVEKARFA